MTNEQIAKKAAEDILHWRLTTTITAATKIILSAIEEARNVENHRMLKILAESDWRSDDDED